MRSSQTFNSLKAPSRVQTAMRTTARAGRPAPPAHWGDACEPGLQREIAAALITAVWARAPAEIFALLTSAPEFLSFRSPQLLRLLLVCPAPKDSAPFLNKDHPLNIKNTRQCSKASVWTLHFSQARPCFHTEQVPGHPGRAHRPPGSERMQKSIVIHFTISFLCEVKPSRGSADASPEPLGDNFRFSTFLHMTFFFIIHKNESESHYPMNSISANLCLFILLQCMTVKW